MTEDIPKSRFNDTWHNNAIKTLEEKVNAFYRKAATGINIISRDNRNGKILLFTSLTMLQATIVYKVH